MTFLFGKSKEKEEKIPELPELPELPPLPDLEASNLLPAPRKPVRSELAQLPAFPTSSTGERISNEAVKRAIFNREEASDEEEISMPLPMESRTREIDTPIFRTSMVREIKPSIKAEPVYVRIDKYQESLSNFQLVKRKLLEIENLLRDIRDIKVREESQLEAWEREIQDAKTKLDSIDKTIFKKLEE